MMNQAIRPGNTGDTPYSLRVLLFITFLWMGYELSRPKPAREQDLLLPDTAGSQGQEWAGLPPWQRKTSEKAIARYAGSQEKKWRHWNEAMFERSG